MHTATNVAPPVDPDQLNAVMADCMALEHVRMFRRLLVKRCGVIAMVIAVSGLALGLRHSVAYWFSVGVFVLAPTGTWIVEHRWARRLSRKLNHISRGVTDVVVRGTS